LFVRANQEKMTAQRLASHEVQHYLPCYRSVRQWKDRRVTLAVPLFPGYVFVRLPYRERARVLSLPNVVSLVGGRNAPAIVSADEIDCIRRGVQFGNAAPHPSLVAGQRVMITSGALRGMQGILLRSQNNTRVVVAIDAIARSFAVEVDIFCLEPLGNVSAPARTAV
jgi:transcription antitermination factor NusG